MSKEVYSFDISRATDAGTLHAYAADIREDETLDVTDKAELQLEINLRFSALNHAANPNPKPRWGA